MKKIESQDKEQTDILAQVATDVAAMPMRYYDGALLTAIEKAAHKANEDDRPTVARFAFSATVQIAPSGTILTSYSGTISIEDKVKLPGYSGKYDANQSSFDFDDENGEENE